MAQVLRHAPWFAHGSGVTNLSKSEGRAFARSLLESDDYREGLKSRIRTRTLEPQIEMMLWHYGYGKPADVVEVSMSEQNVVDAASVKDLRSMHDELSSLLDEMQREEADLLKAVGAAKP